jgi:hypothetical protein
VTLIDEQAAAPEVVTPSPEVVTPSSEATETSPFQPCDNCGSPLDDRQRYCVVCGDRRKHADDPAARFLSSATRRRRTSAAASPASGAKPRRTTASLATAAMIAVIPVTLGAGVLIGRSSAGGDGKLIAALHAQKAPVIQYSGGAPAASGSAASTGATGASTVASVSTTPPTSTFSLKHGYAVELGTLPSSTSQPAAGAAEKSDEAKGASAVGIIAQSDFTVTPSPPGGTFVVYSGSYPTQAAAEKALAKLKKKFPAAKVVKVQSTASVAKSAGKVLTKTSYGSAHQATGYKPNNTALQQGAQVVQQDSHDTGKAASGSGLPDVVAVP